MQKRYTTSELSDLAGVSPRTLRYYDQIGLLCPSRDESGYRCYGAAEIERLQRILLLRSCALPLKNIANSLDSAELNLTLVLQKHLDDLTTQMDITARAIEITKKTLNGLESFMTMNDNEKFEQLKKSSVEKFENEFGEEARTLYGDTAINESNERMLSMSKPAWNAKEELEQSIKEALCTAMATGDTASSESKLLADLHAQWIRTHWGDTDYTPKAHRKLVQSYLDDERFIEYYDGACGQGATEFLRDVILENISL